MLMRLRSREAGEVTKAEQAEVIQFLARRLVTTGGDCGMSSDALISWAALGAEGDPAFRPFDSGDLGRCIRTAASAPDVLREAMEEQVEKWRVDHEGQAA
jgi:hypothetical protein